MALHIYNYAERYVERYGFTHYAERYVERYGFTHYAERYVERYGFTHYAERYVERYGFTHYAERYVERFTNNTVLRKVSHCARGIATHQTGPLSPVFFTASPAELPTA